MCALYIGRVVRALGQSVLCVCVLRENCFGLVVYSGSAQGVIERVINICYYYYIISFLSLLVYIF